MTGSEMYVTEAGPRGRRRDGRHGAGGVGTTGTAPVESGQPPGAIGISRTTSVSGEMVAPSVVTGRVRMTTW